MFEPRKPRPTTTLTGLGGNVNLTLRVKLGERFEGATLIGSRQKYANEIKDIAV